MPTYLIAKSMNLVSRNGMGSRANSEYLMFTLQLPHSEMKLRFLSIVRELLQSTRYHSKVAGYDASP